MEGGPEEARRPNLDDLSPTDAGQASWQVEMALPLGFMVVQGWLGNCHGADRVTGRVMVLRRCHRRPLHLGLLVVTIRRRCHRWR